MTTEHNAYFFIKPLGSTKSVRHLYEDSIVRYELDMYVNSGGLTDTGMSLAVSPFALDEDAWAVQSFRQRNPGFDPGHLQRDVIDIVLSLELCSHGQLAFM